MDPVSPVYVVREDTRERKGVSTESMILLFILLLVFLCMVLLAVTFCRMGSMERAMDMLQLMHMQRGGGGGGGGMVYAPGPLMPPPRSEVFNPYA